MGLVIGIDTGGTFTDLVAFDPATGRIDSLKTSSMPSNPGQAIVNALSEGGIAGGEIATFTHGTTVGTNALIERTGCKVAFLTTRGFEDTPFIQRINRKVLYDLRWQKPAPLVSSRRLCLGIDERMGADGEELRPVDADEVRALCRELRQAGVEAVAVCLLFSYVSTEHEELVKSILAEELPELPVSVSHEVAPIWREYERASTTIADAYLRPLLGRYVTSLSQALRDVGMLREWTIMKSNGGAMLASAASESPVQTVMSGPAGGMTATEHVARALGEPNVLTLDMGGTSADVGILVDGRQRHTTEYEIEWGLPAAVPLIDIKSIGAGGGSVAWVDAGGFLRVGPRSAGAEPGPICYGRGGTEVTVTDANLLLGRLDPGYFLAGRMQLQSTLLDEPFARLAGRVSMEPVELAASVLEIANENMASAIKMVSLERGHDPRRFSLLAFGGAGPLHAASVARVLGIPRVIVPRFPGVFSALGLLLADIRVDKVWTQAFRSNDVDAALVNRQFDRITERAIDELRQEGYQGEPEIRRAINMRYFGQNYEHEVEIAGGVLDDDGLADALRRFDALHAERYGYAIEGEVVELVSFKVTAIGRRPALDLAYRDEPAGSPPVTRPVYFRGTGFMDATVVHRSSLAIGETIAGPALVEEAGSTTLVEPGMTVELHEQGALVIETGASA
ncbi:MAG: hydantoinase/oxoprolinase family protein [Gaiellales bacterium]